MDGDLPLVNQVTGFIHACREGNVENSHEDDHVIIQLHKDHDPDAAVCSSEQRKEEDVDQHSVKPTSFEQLKEKVYGHDLSSSSNQQGKEDVQDGTPSSSVNDVGKQIPTAMTVSSEHDIIDVPIGCDDNSKSASTSTPTGRPEKKRSKKRSPEPITLLTGDQMWLKSIEYKLSVVNFARVHGVNAAAVCCQLDKTLIMEWTKDEAVFRELTGSFKKRTSDASSPSRSGKGSRDTLYSDIDSDDKELPESAEIGKGSSSHKGQRLKSYTIEYKLQAVNYAKEHSVAATAKQFGVDNKQIRYWRQQEDKLRSTAGTGKRILKGQGRPFEYPEIDTELASWVLERKSQGFNITSKALRWKGKQVHMQKGDVNFAASNGWLNSFCRRHDVVLTKKKRREKKPASIAHLSQPSGLVYPRNFSMGIQDEDRHEKKQAVSIAHMSQSSALVFPHNVPMGEQHVEDRLPPQASLYGLHTSTPMQKYIIDGSASYMPTGS